MTKAEIRAEADALVHDTRELAFIEMELNLWRAVVKPEQVRAFEAKRDLYLRQIGELQARLVAMEKLLGKEE